MKRVKRLVITTTMISLVALSALTGCKKTQPVVETSAVTVIEETTLYERDLVQESIEESRELEVESLAEEGRLIVDGNLDTVETIGDVATLMEELKDTFRSDVSNGIMPASDIDVITPVAFSEYMSEDEIRKFISELHLLVPKNATAVATEEAVIPTLKYAEETKAPSKSSNNGATTTQPAPTQPTPTTPAPTQPVPTNPAPTQPDTPTPAPTQPAPETNIPVGNAPSISGSTGGFQAITEDASGAGGGGADISNININ